MPTFVGGNSYPLGYGSDSSTYWITYVDRLDVNRAYTLTVPLPAALSGATKASSRRGVPKAKGPVRAQRAFRGAVDGEITVTGQITSLDAAFVVDDMATVSPSGFDALLAAVGAGSIVTVNSGSVHSAAGTAVVDVALHGTIDGLMYQLTFPKGDTFAFPFGPERGPNPFWFQSPDGSLMAGVAVDPSVGKVSLLADGRTVASGAPTTDPNNPAVSLFFAAMPSDASDGTLEIDGSNLVSFNPKTILESW